MAGRLSWDDYFLAIARTVAIRADCKRRQVGALIVRDKHVLATGYNGAPSGYPGCLTEGACPRAWAEGIVSGHGYEPGSPGYCIAVHAEANAIISAGRADCNESTLYCTHKPCEGCMTLIRGAGIVRVMTLNWEWRKESDWLLQGRIKGITPWTR